VSGGAGPTYRPGPHPGSWEIDDGTGGGPILVPGGPETEAQLRAGGYQPGGPIGTPKIGMPPGMLGPADVDAAIGGEPARPPPAAPSPAAAPAPEENSPEAWQSKWAQDAERSRFFDQNASPAPRRAGGRKAGKPDAPIDPRVVDLVGSGLTVDQANEGSAWDKAQGQPPDPYDTIEEATADRSIDRGVLASNRAAELAGRSEAESAQLGRNIREEQNAIAEQKRRNAEMAHDYQERQMAIDKEREDVAQLKVNPDQWWEDKSGFAQVLAGIAIIAGGVNAGMNGGENQALRAINAAIDQNIQVQREQIGMRREGLRDKENELERLTKLYGSPEAAEAELRDRSRMLVQAIGQKTASDAGAQDAAFNLQQQLAGWNDERVAGQDQLRAALADGVRQDYLRGAVSQVAPIAEALEQPEVEKLGGEIARQQIKPKGGPGAPVRDLSRVVIMPDGSRRWARTDAQAKEQQDTVASNAAVAELAQEIRDIRAQPEDRMPLSAKREAIRTASGKLFLAIKKGEGLGTLDKGALDFRDEFVGKPEDLITIGADAKLEQIQRGASTRVRDTERFYLSKDPEGADTAQAPSAERHYE
jgi:hypothetical protein